MSGFEGRDAVAGYLASKGLPMTGENVRRALEQNAANPGLIKGLVNQAPPPPDAQGGASPTSNQRGSAPDSLAQRMHQTQPSAPSQAVQPIAASDSASSAPTAQPGGGGGLLSSLAQMILGGGAGAGLAHLFMGGRGSPAPMPQLGIPYPTPTADGMPQLPASQAALPAPSPSPSPVGGPAQLSPPEPQVMGPAQIGGPAGMPRGAAPATNVASGAPVSIVPREPGPGNLGGMDWAKILNDVGHTIGRR